LDGFLAGCLFIIIAVLLAALDAAFGIVISAAL
jgi:hypothetical protein